MCLGVTNNSPLVACGSNDQSLKIYIGNENKLEPKFEAANAHESV